MAQIHTNAAGMALYDSTCQNFNRIRYLEEMINFAESELEQGRQSSPTRAPNQLASSIVEEIRKDASIVPRAQLMRSVTRGYLRLLSDALESEIANAEEVAAKDEEVAAEAVTDNADEGEAGGGKEVEKTVADSGTLMTKSAKGSGKGKENKVAKYTTVESMSPIIEPLERVANGTPMRVVAIEIMEQLLHGFKMHNEP